MQLSPAGIWSLSCTEQSRAERATIDSTSDGHIYLLNLPALTAWFFLIFFTPDFAKMVGMNEKTPRRRRGVGVGGCERWKMDEF